MSRKRSVLDEPVRVRDVVAGLFGVYILLPVIKAVWAVLW